MKCKCIKFTGRAWDHANTYTLHRTYFNKIITFHVDTADLFFHDLRVYLTHITPFVRPLKLSDLEPPIRVVVHVDIDPPVFGHYPFV